MNRVTDVTKKIILAGLGSIDEQNEEIKDLLKRGSAIMGLSAVDNEELLYNGNREEIMAKRAEREREDNTLELGHGRSLYYNAVKDENGKVVERNLEYEKKPEEVSREFSIDAKKDADFKKVSVNTSKKPLKDEESKDKKESEGGADND